MEGLLWKVVVLLSARQEVVGSDEGRVQIWDFEVLRRWILRSGLRQ
jgi:hypothetical protein